MGSGSTTAAASVTVSSSAKAPTPLQAHALASGVQVGDRLLDICQVLSKRGDSAAAEKAMRKESAQKLRILATLLETEPIPSLKEYDEFLTGADAGSTKQQSPGKALDLLLGL